MGDPTEKEELLREIKELTSRVRELEHQVSAGQHSKEYLLFSEEKFSKIFKSIPDIVMITSLRLGLVIDVNDSGEKLLGHARDEMIGRPSQDLNIWNDPAERLRMVEELGRLGSVRDFEASLRDKSGRIFSVSVAADTIEIQGERYLIAVMRDISERKKIERELKNKMADLERINRFMVDRELKMIELKKQIQTLEAAIQGGNPQAGTPDV